MKTAKITLAILFLYCGTISSYSQEKSTSTHQVNLKPGDEFVYVKKEKLKYITRFPKGSIISNSPKIEDSKSHTEVNSVLKLYFKVIEVGNDNCYRVNFRVVYSDTKTDADHYYSNYDPRYPSYGTHYRDVINCFLNDVNYQIDYYPSSGKIRVLNLKQIKNELINYLALRKISVDERIEDHIVQILNEERLLRSLTFLSEMNTIVGTKKTSTKRNNGEVLKTKQIEKNNESTTYEYIVDNHIRRPDNSFPKKYYILIGRYTIDNSSGLLRNLHYTSYIGDQDKIQTGKLYQSRSDIVDISGSIELKYYTGSTMPTWVCGKYIGGSSKVMLTTQQSILNGDVKYIEANRDSTGRFSIELDIIDNRLYNVFFFTSRPAITPDLQIYVKPGDSIYICRDSNLNEFAFSGRGFEDSELFHKLRLLPGMDISFHIYHPNQKIPNGMIRNNFSLKNSIERRYAMLKQEKDNISKDFYTFLDSEYNSALGIVKYYEFWNGFADQYRENRKPTLDEEVLLLPEMPRYPDHKFLQFYDPLVTTYINLRFNIFKYQSTGGFPLYPPGRFPDTEFVKLLLEGYPFYLTYGNMIAEQIPGRIFYTENITDDYIVNDYLQNCNHQDSRDYINELLRRREKIIPGSIGPTMNLIGMNGKPYDWNKTKGKVLVLMLYSNYSREPYFAEELYKKYGENHKDIVILRISPGTSFDKWKADNSRYSALGHQMYYADGQFRFNEQFLLDGMRQSSRYLVIDKQGKIFRSIGTAQQIKGAINAALKQAPPPKTPFLETRTGQILPGVLIGFVITFILYRIIIFRRIKKKELLHRLTSLEHKAIKAQLNPHFLFNCLNSIQNLIETNKQKEANEYLLLFAKIIRRILQFSEREEISVQEELETLEIYTDLEKMRFHFNAIVVIDPAIDQYNTMIPPLLLQPVVENAIIHGLHPKVGEKTLRIEVQSRQPSILFRISDNGVGRGLQKNEITDKDKRGLDIVKSRIDIMNKHDLNGYSINIIDEVNKEGKPEGTTVEILVPDEK